MSKLILKDLVESVELDAAAMTDVRGGLNAVINNPQQANQNVVGGFGAVTALNNPVSNPSTVLIESNPVTTVDLSSFNLLNANQNGIFAF